MSASHRRPTPERPAVSECRRRSTRAWVTPTADATRPQRSRTPSCRRRTRGRIGAAFAVMWCSPPPPSRLRPGRLAPPDVRHAHDEADRCGWKPPEDRGAAARDLSRRAEVIDAETAACDASSWRSQVPCGARSSCESRSRRPGGRPGRLITSQRRTPGGGTSFAPQHLRFSTVMTRDRPSRRNSYRTFGFARARSRAPMTTSLESSS